MKKLCLLLSCLLVLGLAPAVVAEDAAPVETIAYEVNESGDTLTVSLTGNATTGYTWAWAQHEDGKLQELSNEYTPDDAAEGQVGVGGTTVITFGAIENVSAGLTTLTFTYAQEWDAESTVTVYELDVDVADGGALTVDQARQALPVLWEVGDEIPCPECGSENATVSDIVYQGDEETGISTLITIDCPECGTIDLMADELPGKAL